MRSVTYNGSRTFRNADLIPMCVKMLFLGDD
jgi:hypothetical protein